MCIPARALIRVTVSLQTLRGVFSQWRSVADLSQVKLRRAEAWGAWHLLGRVWGVWRRYVRERRERIERSRVMRELQREKRCGLHCSGHSPIHS